MSSSRRPSKLGLVTSVGASGSPEQDGLARADNVVQGREGLLEPRRGTARYGDPFSSPPDALRSFAGQLAVHCQDGSLYTWDVAGGGVPRRVSGLFQPASGGARVRFMESTRSLFIARQGGVDRLDSVGGTPIFAGAPAGLDCDATLGIVTGVAIPAGSQVAYRGCFGTRDANGRLILGAPSGRAVVVNANADARNATVGMSIPGILQASAAGWFYRIYRSNESAGATVTPSDEMGLVIEARVPVPVQLVSLQRTGTLVTAVTSIGHTFTAGSTIRIPRDLAGSTGALAVVSNGSGAMRSTDNGQTFGAATLAGAFTALAWNSAVFCAVGNNVLFTSPDGTTWTTQTPAIVAENLGSIAWGGGRFIAIPSVAAPTARTTFSESAAASTSSTSAATSAWVEHDNVAAGTDVWVAFTVRDTSPTYGRNFSTTVQYRVNGGAWTALATLTDTIPSDVTPDNWQDTLFAGSLPASGTIDIRVQTGVAASSNWSTGLASNTLNSIVLYPPARGCQSSTDGATWSRVGDLPVLTAGQNPWKFVVHDGTQFVLVASGGGSATSVDGSSWTAGSASAGSTIRCVASNGSGRTVALGWSPSGWSVGAYTTNGLTWTGFTTPVSFTPTAMAWDPVRSWFIALGSGACATSPDGTTWTARTMPAGAWTAVTLSSGVVVAVGTDVSAYSPDGGVTWVPTSIGTGNWTAIAASPSSSILAGLYPVVGVADSTHFTFNTVASGTVGTTGYTETATPITVGVQDSTASTLLGEAAYWNATQDGMVSSHDLPPDCFDMVEFKGTTFYAAPQRPPAIVITLMSLGSPGGLQNGDTITLPGGVLTAAATEDFTIRQFAISANADSTMALYLTVQSICRVINRNPGLGVTAVQLATASSPTPGMWGIVSSSATSAASVSFTVHQGAAPWSPATSATAQPQRQMNGIAYSLPGIPDAVPALNVLNAGQADLAVQRLVPLRDSLLIIKEEGVWRLTGSSSADWAIHPLDMTCQVAAPESCAVLDNVCIALTESGVVGITDTGVKTISDDIRDDIQALLSPAMRDTTWGIAFGVAYHPEDTYTLWAPLDPGDTIPQQAWTFHGKTSQWTRRTDTFSCAIVLPADNRLWLAADTQVYRERKSLDYTDYADDARSTTLTIVSQNGQTLVLDDATGVGVGDVLHQATMSTEGWANVMAVSGNTVVVDRTANFSTGQANVSCLASIACVIEWQPSYVPEANSVTGISSPSRRMHARGVDLLFKDVRFAAAWLSYESDLALATVDIPMVGSRVGLGGDPTVARGTTIRSLVPREQARCNRLSVCFTQEQAWRPFRLEAMSLTYSVGGERVAK